MPSRRPILLVVPPFQAITHPTLGVSQLKANLTRAGFQVKILYLNLTFAKRIGLDYYKWISLATTDILVGEYIFSHILFGYSQEHLDNYFTDCVEGSKASAWLAKVSDSQDTRAVMGEIVEEARQFSEEAVDLILAEDPGMVCFTTSFQQTCPSLLMAENLKRRDPGLVTVLGGANCTAEMGEELFARFAQIDFIGQGECDSVLVELARALADARPVPKIRGLLSRDVETSAPGYPALSNDELDDLPYPDFADFFSQLRAHGLDKHIEPGLLMETSRGCWWGAKQHCTFCGYNAEAMVYRRKSAPRAYAEMQALVERYGLKRIAFADNILPMDYFKTLIPMLEEDPVAEVFYEVKSNLRREQVEQLKRAGVSWIQPGIESLSDKTLNLMRKGCTGLQNIALLKWCSESGIYVSWNHLYGFPGEDDAEMPGMIENMEFLHHLQPPSHSIVLEIDRFSPYFYNPKSYGLSPMKAAHAYRHVYPFGEKSLGRIAFRFRSEFLEKKEQSPEFAGLKDACERWQTCYPLSHLVALPRRDCLTLLDTRRCAARFSRKLHGLERRVYEFCDHARNRAAILQAFSSYGEAPIRSILDDFEASHLMLRGGEEYLSLATRGDAAYRALGRVQPHGTFLNPSRETPANRQGLTAMLERIRLWRHSDILKRAAIVKRWTARLGACA